MNGYGQEMQNMAALHNALADYEKVQRREGAMADIMARGDGYSMIGAALGNMLANKFGTNSKEAETRYLEEQFKYQQAQNAAAAESKAHADAQKRALELEDASTAHNRALELAKAKGDASFNNSMRLQRDKQSFDREQTKSQREYDMANKKPDYSQGDSLRQELNKQTSDFPGVTLAYDKITNAYQNPSPANDISMLFSIMKMNDPGSTVREGEIATAQNAAGVDERIRGMYNNLKTGAKLTPAQREDFFNSASGLYQAAAQNYQATYDQYADLAKRQGLDPNEIYIQRGIREMPEKDEQARNQQGGQIMVDANGNRAMVFPDGSFKEL